MPRYLNSDLVNLADATGLKNQMDTDIWSLGWPETVKRGIDSLTSFAQSITPSVPENPLPIITGPRPQVQPIQSLDEMQRMWDSGNGDIQDTQSSGPDTSAGPAPASAPAAYPSAAGAPSLPQGTIDNSSRESFVRTAYPYMLQAAGGNKDAAEMMLAAAISENGDVGKGRGFIGNNFYGLKGKGPAGSVTSGTWEQTPQGPVHITDEFAAYNTPVEGFGAFFDFLQQNPRYAPALAAYQKTGDAQQLFADVNAAGYATDPQWASKVASIRANQVAPVTQALQTGAAQTSEVPSGQASAPTTTRPTAQPAVTIDQAALDDPDKWSLCGPVAATMAAQRYGPNWTVAQAKALAVKNGLWDAGTGMHGLDSEVQLLNGMGISARTGPASQAALAADAAAGNTPIISTNRHYFVLKGYNPQTGQFDTDTTGTVLKGGSRWLTLDQIAALGGGIQGAAYMDNPTTPAPSVAAGPSPTAGQPPAESPPQPPVASASSRTDATGAPDLMLRQPLGPATAGPDTTSTDVSAAQQDTSGALPPWEASSPPPTGSFQDDYSDAGHNPLPTSAAPVSVSGAVPGIGPGASAPSPQVIPNEDQTSYGPAPQPNGTLGIVDTSGPEQGPQQPVPASQVLPNETPPPNWNLGRGWDTPPGVASGVPGAPDLSGYQKPQDTADEQSMIDAILRKVATYGEAGRHAASLAWGAIHSGTFNPHEAFSILGMLPYDLYARARQELISDREAIRTEGTDPFVGARPLSEAAFGHDYLPSAEDVNPEGRPAGDVLFGTVAGAVVPGQEFVDPLAAGGFHAAGAGLALGARGVQAAGRAAIRGTQAVGRGASAIGREIQAGAERAAAGQAGAPAYGVFGPVPNPSGETRIPRAGYASDLSQGAEDMVRRASEANAPRETVSRAEVAQKAQDILGVDPEAAQRWQNEALAEAPATRAVRGEALRQAEYIDAEAANAAIERLRAAQQRAQNARDGGLILSEADHAEIADAVLGAAEAARAFERSAAASTAEGRATARALNQRRNAIMARAAYEAAARARQVGQDAAFAAQEALRASRTGELTPAAEQRLRTLRDKLANPERHGLVDDALTSRLDETAQGSTTAAAVAGPVASPRLRLRSRSEQAQPVSQGVPMGTRLATDIGNAALGSVVGGAGGYGLPAQSEEERRRHAFQGAVLGGIGFPVAGRLMGRGRGALGTFGPAPTPEMPNRAIAVGADPSKRYEFRYRVADLGDLVPSNLPNGAPNPKFPSELQPRDRSRVGSQLQIDQIAKNLEPDALLTDVGRLDSGPMIVGSDNVVESGNGRTLALQKAAKEYPEQYQAYVDSLRQNLGQYGLDESALAGKNNPVLVRERVSQVDRPAFAQEANNAGLLRMSSFEQAAQDAGNLRDEVVTGLDVGENDTIATALRRAENRDVVRGWVATLPENERAGVIDAQGNLSAQGYERLTNALLVKTYGQGAGEKLAQTFIESADPSLRNVQTALMASLPDVARSEALVRSGQRAGDLSIADDVAAATEMLARLRRDGIPVSEFLSQTSFVDRELTPFQEDILRFLDQNQRRPNAIRETLREYANRVENAADPNQAGMFGEAEVAPVSREEMWNGARSAVEQEAQARQAARRAPANGPELAQPGPESLSPASEIVPRGGPAGTLAQEGAPEPLGRPGPVPEGMAPAGGPEGRLRAEGAPPEPANLPPVEGVPAGGPEGTLRQQGAPEPLTRPSDVAPLSEGAAPAGGPQGSLQAPPLGTPAQQRALEQSRIRGVVSQIDDVLSNPTAPGSTERLAQLHQDLQDISKAGFERSSQLRQRLYRQNLLKAGMSTETGDVEALVNALANADPSDPSTIRPILNAVQRPSLWGLLREMQFVNMLSSPVTHAVNASSNALQLAGRLLLNNPLEFIGSGGTSTGTGAAFVGAARGAREGFRLAKEIMRTGVNPDAVERAIETGAIGQMGRELLTEKFGRLGAAMHMVSTRPLEAMDALLGHMAYASAAEQYAQRTADRLLQSGSAAVKGMSREQARQHVLSNIWDYPDVIEKAGKIQDYTLLKSRDVEGGGWARVERGLRYVAGLRNLPEKPGFADYAIAGLTDFIAPFFNVPLNFAKQGAERTAGAPINLGRAALAAAGGDRERAGELFAKGMIGAATMGTAAVLAAGDNLTLDGPTDPGQRKVWLEDHQPNSVRVPGTNQWVSYQGTPWAIPFATVAGAKEAYEESNRSAEKKGLSSPEVLVGTAAGTYRGAAQGFMSQSFMQGIAQQYQFLTGQDTGLGAVSANLASAGSRYTPVVGSSLLNFLARVTDGMERDAGKPLSLSDLPGNVATRLEQRIPGLREQTPTRLGAYGEDVANQTAGPAGLLPLYRGGTQRPGDAITQRLEEAQVGAPLAPTTMPIPNLPPGQSIEIPLSMDERHVYEQAAGQKFRQILEQTGAQDASRFPPEALQQMRTAARQYAEAQVARSIGNEEMTRRVREAVANRRKAS